MSSSSSKLKYDPKNYLTSEQITNNPHFLPLLRRAFSFLEENDDESTAKALARYLISRSSSTVDDNFIQGELREIRHAKKLTGAEGRIVITDSDMALYDPTPTPSTAKKRPDKYTLFATRNILSTGASSSASTVDNTLLSSTSISSSSSSSSSSGMTPAKK